MKPKRVLILGGTTEARELITKISLIPGLEVINSLAGCTLRPVIMWENTRLGGFGGVPGLKQYLEQQQIDILIDATHPFAAQISENAAIAAGQLRIPHLMLVRPVWEKTLEDQWIEVTSNQAAAMVLPGLAQRVFLTIGRQELATYAYVKEVWFLMRMIDPPISSTAVPAGKLILERGPFTLKEEKALLETHAIGAIVSKNSGGEATMGKIIAAREAKIPVVMVQRPGIPQGEKVSDIEKAISWLESL